MKQGKRGCALFVSPFLHQLLFSVQYDYSLSTGGGATLQVLLLVCSVFLRQLEEAAESSRLQQFASEAACQPLILLNCGGHLFVGCSSVDPCG